ncbi:MAG: ABC transporter ATP-binding protein [Paracoccaceae bacterium]|jgi:multiple sugar transport system ATP-binding protein
MGAIELRNVEKWFGEVQVIKGIDLAIEEGEFIIFVGPSGCGKSTLLRMIAGLEETSRGSILIDGTDITAQPPAKRGLAMVFQSYALYPHMSVRDNVGFGLKTAGRPKDEIKQMVDDAAAVLRLEDYLDRRPKDLSGGQRQRVAIGRAIVRDPTAFLFDEPLSNLDAALRVEMRYEIAKLSQTLNSTMIYVTHDQVEAMTLADRIVVLQDGKIEQIGTPKQLYNSPSNLFVAQFIGSPKMNILPCSSSHGQIELAGGGRVPDPQKGQVAQLGIRPEAITLTDPGMGQIDGTVDVVEYLGADTYLIINCGELVQVTVRADGENALEPGAQVGLAFAQDKLHYFDGNGNAL